MAYYRALGRLPRQRHTQMRDDDGHWFILGRSDDMFKVSGIWVSPFEVEATLMQHPAVREAAARFGDRTAFVDRTGFGPRSLTALRAD